MSVRSLCLAVLLLLASVSAVCAADANDYGVCSVEATRLLAHGGVALKVTAIKNDRDKLTVTYTYQFGTVSVPYDLDTDDDTDTKAAIADIHSQMDQEEAAQKAGNLYYLVVNLYAVAQPGDPIAYKGMDGSTFPWTPWTQYVMYEEPGENGPECQSSHLGNFVYADVLPKEVLKLLPKDW